MLFALLEYILYVWKLDHLQGVWIMHSLSFIPCYKLNEMIQFANSINWEESRLKPFIVRFCYCLEAPNVWYLVFIVSYKCGCSGLNSIEYRAATPRLQNIKRTDCSFRVNVYGHSTSLIDKIPRLNWVVNQKYSENDRTFRCKFCELTCNTEPTNDTYKQLYRPADGIVK